MTLGDFKIKIIHTSLEVSFLNFLRRPRGRAIGHVGPKGVSTSAGKDEDDMTDKMIIFFFF